MITVPNAHNLLSTMEPDCEPIPIGIVVAFALAYTCAGRASSGVSSVLAGAAVFLLFEEWTFGESFYFCVVSLMTIGFGDLYPSSRNMQSAKGSVPSL